MARVTYNAQLIHVSLSFKTHFIFAFGKRKTEIFYWTKAINTMVLCFSKLFTLCLWCGWDTQILFFRHIFFLRMTEELTDLKFIINLLFKVNCRRRGLRRHLPHLICLAFNWNIIMQFGVACTAHATLYISKILING